jgi:hypothetical protein
MAAKSTEQIIDGFVDDTDGASKTGPDEFVAVNEGDPPRFSGFGGYKAPTCCAEGDKSGDPREHDFPEYRGKSGAIRLSFLVSFSGHDSGGIKEMRAYALSPEGKIRKQSGSTWKPDQEAEDRSKTGSISHTFSICVPCRSFVRSPSAPPTVRFIVFAEDTNDNVTAHIIGFIVDPEQFANCCGAA